MGKNEYITSRNIKDLMMKLGHQNKLDQLDYRLLIDRFDLDGDGLISFSEFKRFILPSLTDTHQRII